MYSRATIITLLFLYLQPFDLFCQEYIYNAQLITTDDGLSNLLTTAIHQDKDGFIWIGTQYGLDRYDGNTFGHYTREENGLRKNESIRKIQEDEEDNLWLFHSEGKLTEAIDIFDKKTEKAIPIEEYFNTLPFKLEEITVSQVRDPQKRIWISTNSGEVYLYEKGQFHKVYEDKGAKFSFIIIDGLDNIWLGFNSEVVCINQSGDILERYNLPGNTRGIWCGDDQTVWISSTGSIPGKPEVTTWERNNDTKELERFTFSDENGILDLISIYQESTLGGEVFTHRDTKGFWYVHTHSQSFVFDKAGVKLFHFNTLLGNENIHIPFLIFLESGEYMWWCTPNGIFKTGVKKNPFQLIHQTKGYLSDSRGITEDKSGNLFFLNHFLYSWHTENNSLSKVIPGIHTGHALTYKDSLLFLGTYKSSTLGYQVDLRTRRQTALTPLNGTNFFCTLPSRLENKLLIGTTAGLEYIDMRNDKVLPFKKYKSGNPKDELIKKSRIYHLHQNDSGIWAATDKGVFLLNEDEGILKHFDHTNVLPFNHIMHIHEDKEEDIFWLATKGGGVIKWQNPNNERAESIIQQFTIKDGLSNNYLYAIYEDANDRLWIPSDKGIMCMDKHSHQIIKTYLTKDGLAHNEFNTSSHYQAKEGKLYFGGLGGLVSFHPDSIQINSYTQTPLEFTAFHLLEEGKAEMTNRTILLKNEEEIAIKPSDKMFELRFALLDFDDPQNHSYTYQIDGYTDSWQTTKDNYLRITHLPYGDYTLRIKGQNVNQGWSKNELSLPIRMLKPFYLQGWFLGLLTLSVLGLTVFIIKRRESILKKDKERLEREVQKRTLTIREQAEELKELDKAKTRFFSNITHEFRTPLTLIIGPLEQLLEKKESLPIRQQLFGVFKNARQLLILINQMLDLSKLEGKRMRVEVVHGDIVYYTYELIQRFQPLTEKKAQQLNFHCELESWKTHFDKNKWNKIIYNLVSNAIKFTAKEGLIEVQLNKIEREEYEFIQLIVEDTGIGMGKETLGKIFDRFYQVDASSTRVQGGTGIGLSLVKELVELQEGTISVKSDIGLGTTFKIELPVVLTESPLQDINLEKEVLAPVLAKPVSALVQVDETISQASLLEEENEKLTLLLIEDNDEMRAYIRECIDESNYQFIEARDGQEGINEALAQIPDLIISDVMMPKKNGFEVVRTIRTNFITSHIPIILLTAKASLESRLTAFKRGADAYLTKPFSPQELTLRIQKLIEIRQMLQARYATMQDTLPSNNGHFELEDEFMIKLKKYITENLTNPNLNAELICQQFGVSRMALYRKLKALTNQGISEIIRSVRLKVATNLIREGQLNFSEIAYETGFSSLSHFSRTFKKIYGQSPSDLREKMN